MTEERDRVRVTGPIRQVIDRMLRRVEDEELRHNYTMHHLHASLHDSITSAAAELDVPNTEYDFDGDHIEFVRREEEEAE